MYLTVDFISQVIEKAQHLSEDKMRLILEVMDGFLPNDDELSDNDLHFITLAEEEYKNRETVSWLDVEWKTTHNRPEVLDV